jgi:ribulose-bisphosphate carboxylase large chain
MGVDFIHAGMWGGYLNTTEEELREVMYVLHENGVMPSLSCGMHCGLIDTVNEKFGTDYMANCGGSIHGHPNGTLAGAKALRQAIDKEYGEEYDIAIKKWGKK